MKKNKKRVISAEELIRLARESENEKLARLILDNKGNIVLNVIDQKGMKIGKS